MIGEPVRQPLGAATWCNFAATVPQPRLKMPNA
jgi:hypothetical protein